MWLLPWVVSPIQRRCTYCGSGKALKTKIQLKRNSTKKIHVIAMLIPNLKNWEMLVMNSCLWTVTLKCQTALKTVSELLRDGHNVPVKLFPEPDYPVAIAFQCKIGEDRICCEWSTGLRRNEWQKHSFSWIFLGQLWHGIVVVEGMPGSISQLEAGGLLWLLCVLVLDRCGPKCLAIHTSPVHQIFIDYHLCHDLLPLWSLKAFLLIVYLPSSCMRSRVC